MGMLNVFLDTNEYDRCGHNFRSTPFMRLKDLADTGVIQIYSTNVVIGEVSAHISEDVQQFLELQKGLAKKARVIQNIPQYKDIICKLDATTLEEQALTSFSDFLNSVNCITISSNEIANDDLISDYFNKRFPFEANVKKGDEFKDAFIVYALKKCVEDEDIEMTVISSDIGLCSAFIGNTRFKYFKKCEEFFAYLSYLEEISAANFDKLKDDITNSQMLSEKIENSILYGGINVDDAEDVDDENITIDKIELEYIDDIDEDSVEIHICAKVTVAVECDIINHENSYWDKEEQKYLFLETQHIRFTKEIAVNVNATALLEMGDESRIVSILDYDNISIENNRYGIDIPFDMYEDAYEVVYSSNDRCLHGAYTECPDCGDLINFENDGGNGFCTNCAPNH